MARTLSEDLRLRVISAVEAGLSRRAAAERFGIGIATAIRWVRAFKATGTTRAQPKGGDQRSHRIEVYRDVILDAVSAQVDITLVELADMLRQEHGLHVAPSTVWRFLDRHAMTVKKNRTRQRARTGPTLWLDGRPGSTRSRNSIRNVWSLSMKPVHPPKWHACGAELNVVNVAARPSPTATGKRRPSPAPCA